MQKKNPTSNMPLDPTVKKFLDFFYKGFTAKIFEIFSNLVKKLRRRSIFTKSCEGNNLTKMYFPKMALESL